jgi:hypothetical protein
MINASGQGLIISFEVNAYGYMLWLWIKLWISIKVQEGK